MPELPEVEAFKMIFNRSAVNKKITEVSCKDATILQKISCAQLQKKLIGKRFSKAVRKGKFLIVPVAKTDLNLIFHFGLTGYLAAGKQNQIDPEDLSFAKVAITFDNKKQLIYGDPRKFGKIYLSDNLAHIKTLKTLGPDALAITKKEFLALMQKHSHKNVKAFLMDQSIIAGIGNNYSNEIFFQAKINPSKSIAQLSDNQRAKLYTTMRTLLKKALTFDTLEAFPKTWVIAHKKDMKCPRNKKHTLLRKKIAGRTAIFCPLCQK